MKCYICKQDKETSEFYRNNTRKRGFSSACKTCHNEYNRKNYKSIRKYNSGYFNRPDGVFIRYRYRARKKNYVFELTLDDFIRDWGSPCSYCGRTDYKLGYDRIDNNIGYTKKNSIPCCAQCNYIKGRIESIKTRIKKTESLKKMLVNYFRLYRNPQNGK